MYCTKCGTSLSAGAAACSSCGKPVPAQAPAPTIPNYLVQSILVTLCCCMPFGIVAIVYAAQVNAKLAGGDIAGALESSRNAKMWSWIGFACGAVISLIYMAISGLSVFQQVRGGH
jgi:hypothetical protein